jgi:predicted ATP-grasp superfamily ATP-dependent carboligase
MTRGDAGYRSAWPHIVILEPYNAGLALARRMVALGAPVTVVEGEPIVAYSRGVQSIIAPYERDGDGWLEALRALAGSSRQAAVFTATDRASAWLVDAAASLPPNVRAFEHPGGAHLALMDKVEANRIARRAGVRVPWTGYVRRSEELAAVLAEAPWPCVIKPVFSHKWRDRYGERRAFLVADASEAHNLMCGPLEDGFQMLLSQYIPGGDDDVEEAIVVRLADGSYPVHFGCRKLRQYPSGFGETALGESSELLETTALARRLLDEAAFVGVAGVEAKRHAETEERWFLEVNVRLPGQWGLGDACGVQASRRLVAALCDRQLDPQPPLVPRVRFVQADLDWHGVLPAIRQAPPRQRGRLAWRLLRPYFGAGEFGVLDLRDPGPLLALARLFIERRLAYLRDRVRGLAVRG